MRSTRAIFFADNNWGYNNGEKNGEWCYYARNRVTGKKEYIEKKEFYKDGEVIWETNYYEPNKSGKQQVKDHREPVNDGVYKWCRKTWLPNGILSEEFYFKNGSYNDKSIVYHKNGNLKYKTEDGIIHTYSDDGTTLLTKEDKNKKFTENYLNGEITQTIQEYKDHNKETVFEVIEYKNGEKLSQKIIDINGQDMEAKYEMDKLKAEYEQCKEELDGLLYPIMQQSSRNKYNLGVSSKQAPCIKQHYYYAKRIEELWSTYYRQESAVDKIANKSKDFTSGDLNADKLKRIHNYIIEIKENYIPQKNNLTSIKSGLDNLITSLQLTDCNFIDLKVVHKGSGHTNYTLSVEIKAKKKLFEEYSQVEDYLMDNITNGSSDVFITSIQQYNIISSNFLKWKNANTSDIEKQLKKAKTVREKLEIFLSVGAN